MRFIAIALAASVTLAGCQTITNVDDAIQKQLPGLCKLIGTAHAAFISIDATRPLPANVVKDEAAAYAAAAVLCADPTHVTVANALVTAAEVYKAITKALRAAEAAGG